VTNHMRAMRLVTRSLIRNLRAHPELMNYEYWGCRRSTDSAVNFHLFIADLVQFAPQAFQPTSTQTYLSFGPMSLYAIDSDVEFVRRATIELLIHREIKCLIGCVVGEASSDIGDENDCSVKD